MKRKIWKAAAAAGLFAVLTLAPAGIAMAAGWTQTANGWTYVQNDGTLRKAGSRLPMVTTIWIFPPVPCALAGTD